MNEAQRLVVAKDQFALKRLSDDALRQIMPAYKQAAESILRDLKYLPTEGGLYREFWLNSQLKTIEKQLNQIGTSVKQVLPAKQLEAFEEGLKNAEAFLRADGISPPVPQTQLAGTTASGQTVTQTGNLPGLGIGNDPAFISSSNPAGEFIQPSITRQQVLAAAQDRGFSEFLEGKRGANKRNLSLSQLLETNTQAQVNKVSATLREGFLLGRSNDDIARRIGDAFGGKTKGQMRAMTEAVVRTGMAEASQAAHDMFYKANEDLLPKVPGGYKWEWDASNDTRLCPVCAPRDGLRFKERSDAPEWPAHFNCRCKILPITATQAALRDRGDVPAGSFLEQRPVEYTKSGKRVPPPAGWTGDNAYKRPKRINGEMYWVRRRDLPKGKTLAGDMLKEMDDENKLAILGTKDNLKDWNRLIKSPKYQKDPQALVRRLLSGGENPPKGMTGPQRPKPPKPPGSGPKPKPKKPTPKPSPHLVNDGGKAFKEAQAADSEVKRLKKELAAAKKAAPKPKTLQDTGKDLIATAAPELNSYVSIVRKSKVVYPKRVEAIVNAVTKEDKLKARKAYNRAMAIEQRAQAKINGAMDKVKKAMLETDLTKEQQKAFMNNIEFEGWLSGRKGNQQIKEHKEIVSEFMRMFNGKGFTATTSGTPWVKKISPDLFGRGSNNPRKGHVNVRIGSRENMFHELMHTVEAQRPSMQQTAKDWIISKAYDEKNIRLPSALKGQAVKVVKDKPQFRLKDITGMEYRDSEVAWTNDFINGYMGKDYGEAALSTEVWTVGVEHFADTRRMGSLFRRHPDLFQMIVGLSRGS